MLNYFYRAGGRIFLRFLILMVFTAPAVVAQQESNLNVIVNLIDSSAARIGGMVEAKNITLNSVLRDDYGYLRNEIAAAFTKYKILANIDRGEPSIPQINYMISEIRVKYGEVFRKGFLGSFYNERGVEIKGEYSILDLTGDSPRVVKDNFEYKYIDTVKRGAVGELENITLPFTMGEIPAEPFWDSIVEPVIAITAAAAGIALFFFIRSK